MNFKVLVKWQSSSRHKDPPKQSSAQPLTAMNSALELTNCLKQSKKFSSVGRIWANLTEKWQENGSGENTRWLLDMPGERSCRLSGELFVSNIPQMDNSDINNKELQPQRPGYAQLRNTHKIYFSCFNAQSHSFKEILTFHTIPNCDVAPKLWPSFMSKVVWMWQSEGQVSVS